jgi:hypothetical protein
LIKRLNKLSKIETEKIFAFQFGDCKSKWAGEADQFCGQNFSSAIVPKKSFLSPQALC